MGNNNDDRTMAICKTLTVWSACALAGIGVVMILAMLVGSCIHANGHDLNYEELVKFNIVGAAGLGASTLGFVIAGLGPKPEGSYAAHKIFVILFVMAVAFTLILFWGQGVGKEYSIYYYDVEGDGYDPDTDKVFKCERDVNGEFLEAEDIDKTYITYGDPDRPPLGEAPNGKYVKVTTSYWSGFNLPSNGDIEVPTDVAKAIESRPIHHGIPMPHEMTRRLLNERRSIPNDFREFITLFHHNQCVTTGNAPKITITSRENRHTPTVIPLVGLLLGIGICYVICRRVRRRSRTHSGVRSSLTVRRRH